MLVTKTVVLPPAAIKDLANIDLIWLRLCSQGVIPFFSELKSCKTNGMDGKGVVVEVQYLAAQFLF